MTKQTGLILFFYLFIFCISHFSVAYAAGSSTPTLIGTYGAWKAYSYNENGGLLCFMSSNPRKAEGKYTKRGDIFAMISHRPAEKSRDVFSYITGYTYKSGAEVTVTIDGKKFALFGQGENAWTPNNEQDRLLASAIQKGSNMTVEGTSSRGTRTKDIFSLKGSGDAYATISKACGL